MNDLVRPTGVVQITEEPERDWRDLQPGEEIAIPIERFRPLDAWQTMHLLKEIARTIRPYGFRLEYSPKDRTYLIVNPIR